MINKLDNILKKKDIQFVCNIMSKTFMLPIHFLDKNGDVLFESLEGFIHSPVFPCKSNVFNNLIENNDIYNFPILKINSFYETFFYI